MGAWEPVFFMIEQNFFLVFMLLLSATWAIQQVFSRLIEKRERVALQEQRTKQIQAFASMDAEGQQKLLAMMPDWIDHDDPKEVEAWKAARREVLQLTKEP